MKSPRAPFRPSLRSLIVAVAIGSVFLPAMLVGAIFTLTQGEVERGPIMRDFVAAREARRAVTVDSKGRLAARRGYASPAWLDLVVCDLAGEVVFSTMPSFPAGARADLGAMAERATALVPHPTFIADTLEEAGRPIGTWYAILPVDAARSFMGEREPYLNLAIYALISAFAFALSVIVAAFIVVQLGRLERAAATIAAGDLEKPVERGWVREIAALAEAMEGMRTAILESQARRARFLAAVSHDLRTPLTSIGGYLEAVEDGLAEDPETLRRYVAVMREKTRTLEERVEGLIDFARMESGEWRLRFEPQDLGDLFGAFAEEAREMAALAGARCEVDLSALSDLAAQGDRVLLGRAFENLVANALSHGRPRGLVRVSARRLGGEPGTAVAVDVDDDGPGIPEGDRDHAFEAFWRGPRRQDSGSETGREGSGLGLYIARSIIEGHGWRLDLGVSPQGGARFTISLSTSPDPMKDGAP